MAILIVFCGCAGIVEKTPDLNPEAQRLLITLKSINQGLQRFKGIGKIKIRYQNRKQWCRTVWAGDFPEKIRVDAIGITGQPLFSFTDDGEYFSAVSHYEKQFYRRKSKGKNLKRVLDIPLKTTDILTLISGKVPFQKYDYVELDNSRDDNMSVLVLKKKWIGVVENIYFDKKSENVKRIEIYDISGNISYIAEYISVQKIEGYFLPKHLLISNGKGDQLEVKIEKFYPNSKLKASMFRIDKTPWR